MSNENWNNSESTPEVDPWDRPVYQTGSTTPPKSRGGLVAALLVLTISLFGVMSIMTVLNIKIMDQLTQPDDPSSPISIYEPESTGDLRDDQDPTWPVREDIPDSTDGIDIEDSLPGVENIPQEGGLSLQQIYETCIDSVVSISCTSGYGTATGTGVVLTEDGYIVTNAHVVEGAQSIQVTFNDDSTVDAVLIGADAVSDLAVLWVDEEDLSPATFGDSDMLRVGDAVVAIGDPMGVMLRGTMTEGIVSGINRDIVVDGRSMTLIQTSAALNEGNSGGPLINCYGQVIGINTMKIGDSMSSAGVEGLGFAIPSTIVRDIVNQLISQGYVSGRPDLGLEGEAVSRINQIFGNLPRGLYITEVDPDSDAAAKGIQEGDVLMYLGDVRINGEDEYQTQLYNYQVGDTVRAVIYRSGRQYELTLTVGEAQG